MAEATRRAARRLTDGEVVDVTRLTTRVTMTIAAEALFGSDGFDEVGGADELGEALTIALHWAAVSAISFGFGLQVELGGMLGRLSASLPADVAAPLLSVSDRLTQPILWPGRRSGELRAAIALLDERVQRMIDERRAEPGARRDLLARLLEVKDDATGSGMSDRQLRDEIVTLFVAGHETTATALAWALYFLGRDPPLYAAVEGEARALE
jgi:cytochrome P450